MNKPIVPTEHVLKCWPAYFDAVERGDKTFEVRKDDRGFQRGDTLRLQRTDPDRTWEVEFTYDGKVKREIVVEIIYVLTGGQFGIEAGYVVLGIRPTEQVEHLTV